MKKGKYLITGSAGFIGINLVKNLYKKHDLILVDDLSEGSLKNFPKHLRKKLIRKKIQDINKLFEIAKYIELSLTNTELESLLHEQFLIKKYKPKFNVQFKDDKGYPWIKVETDKDFPSAKS